MASNTDDLLQDEAKPSPLEPGQSSQRKRRENHRLDEEESSPAGTPATNQSKRSRLRDNLEAFSSARNIEEQKVDTPDVRRTMLSPATVQRFSTYHAGLSRRAHERRVQMFDEAEQQEEEDEEEEEDYDYEEGEDDEQEEEDQEEENGVQMLDMGSFAEPGRKFLSKAWKEFEPVHVNGVVEKAECKHCARKIGAKRTSGTSSLRKHLKRCIERKKAFRAAGQLDAAIMSPDGVALGMWIFSQEAAYVELVKMIVLHELPFSFVEYDGFRRFVSSLNPRFKIVCRKTMRNDCVKVFLNQRESYQQELNDCKTRVSLTMDLWTSNQTVAYMCVTIHYIDEGWNTRKGIIKFAVMETPHTGGTLFNVMVKTLQDWKIEDKLFAITLDNATNNGSMMKLLKGHLKDKGLLLAEGKLLHQHCAAHVINLICQAGLDFLNPIINKIRESVKYIRVCPSRKELFEEIIRQVGISCDRRPCLDVVTRWNSTYRMLVVALLFRRAFDVLAIRDLNYTFKPSLEDWENAEVVCSLLKVFYDATNVISGTHYPTSNLHFIQMWQVKLILEKQNLERDSSFSKMIKLMQKKFKKYWKLSWVALCIPVILDPSLKLRFLEFRFSKEYGDESTPMIDKIKKVFHGLFEEYAKLRDDDSNHVQQAGSGVEMGSDNVDALADWDQHITETARSIGAASCELDSYLAKLHVRRSEQFDVLAWWRMNSTEYPVLSAMAKDVLAVSASTVPSESAFSTGKRVISDFRSRMTPETVEALVCLQDWLRSGGTSGMSLASIHDVLIFDEPKPDDYA